VAAAIRARLEPVLPLSATQREEREVARRAAEEQARVEAELRRLEEARQRAAAQEQARRDAAEAEARHREEETLLEERRRLAAAEAEVRAREEAERRAVAQAEHDREEAERAARRAAEAEARRARREAHRADREQARTSRHAAGHRHGPGGHGDADDQLTGRRRADDPTRELSLTDELFGSDDDDRTVQLPRVTDRGDDR
jgi:membrane protein involved in colicin uptake